MTNSLQCNSEAVAENYYYYYYYYYIHLTAVGRELRFIATWQSKDRTAVYIRVANDCIRSEVCGAKYGSCSLKNQCPPIIRSQVSSVGHG